MLLLPFDASPSLRCFFSLHQQLLLSPPAGTLTTTSSKGRNHQHFSSNLTALSSLFAELQRASKLFKTALLVLRRKRKKKKKMEEKDLNLLNEALGLHNNNNNLYGRFVVVEDCVDTSAAFVLHHILKRSFSSNPSSSVIFLALSNPFSHYDRILRKLGCNLAAQRDNNRFFFIDLLKLQYPDEGKPNQNGFAAVFEKIERVIKTLHQDNMKSITIMIDDISFLEVAANGSSNDVLDFLHYCYTLTSEYGCAFVALDHKDIYLDGEKPAVILEMEYLADILVKAEPLATGLAKDVHGQLMVLHKETQCQHGISPIKIHNFHYKIKENSIECFYPGTKIK